MSFFPLMNIYFRKREKNNHVKVSFDNFSVMFIVHNKRTSRHHYCTNYCHSKPKPNQIQPSTLPSLTLFGPYPPTPKFRRRLNKFNHHDNRPYHYHMAMPQQFPGYQNPIKIKTQYAENLCTSIKQCM